MVPIIREGEKWIKANVYKKWYNYITSDWANVVLVKEASRNNYKNAAPGTEILEQDILAYLVWIPRYRYKLFNVSAGSSAKRTIEIEFETKKTAKSNGSTNGTWLTHPAFTFGSDELEGFWVGKFETTGYATAPTVKPYGPLFQTTDINDQFNTLKKFNNELNYGITSSFDAHMMKNMEWGAVAYLYTFIIW